MEGNGDWIRHLDEKFDQHQRWLVDKLDKKSDKEDVERLESRVEKVESKTNKIELRMAGIAGIVSAGVVGAKAAVLKLLGI